MTTIQERLREPLWLDDAIHAGTPDDVIDIVHRMRRERREAADEIDRLVHALGELRAHHDAAVLISEVLRRQMQIRDICEDGDPANQEAYDRLRRQNAAVALCIAALRARSAGKG